MQRKVFILDKDELGICEETAYTEIEIMHEKNEAALQKCLEKFPELIPANQIDFDNPPKFLVIKAEAGVTPGSIDILMLDNNGVLNIVETKLYQNREIRRAVIGQALEYAAHLVMEWDADKIRNEGSRYWQGKDMNFDNMIADKLDVFEDDKEEFWDKVKHNLEEMKIRIIITADQVPKELRQTVEFVNRNSKFEILALEVKLFTDEKGRKVLVPYIIGVSEKKKISSLSSERQLWSFQQIEEKMQEEENEVRRGRFLEMLKYCCELNAFKEGNSKRPSFRVCNKEGQNFITFNGDGTVFVGLRVEMYGGQNDLDVFFDRLNQLSIFKFEKSDDYEHWRWSKGRIEELTDKEFTDLKNIIKDVYESKAEET